MQDIEEQDTCRICSAPAEPGQPLFHPCKCSGTIRYIHQDCLTTWLAHSKKKSCDVCKHPYSFTKVYATDMPSTLPPTLLIRRLIQQSFYGLIFSVRATTVGIIWLAVLPWITVWTWRMYFSMGESTAWWIADRPRPTPGTNSASPFYYNISANASLLPPESIFARFPAHPVWVSLSSDIFAGQIIASLIVLTFVAVFLLREWISQNARPGMFEDDEMAEGEGQRRPQDLGPLPNGGGPNQGQRRRGQIPDQLAFAQQQMEAIRALDAMRTIEGNNGHIVGTASHGRRRYYVPKGKQPEKIETIPARVRRKIQCDTEFDAMEESERARRRAFSRRLHVARLSGARRKAELAKSKAPATPPSSESGLFLPPGSENFDFTFRHSTPRTQRATSEPHSLTSSPRSTPEHAEFQSLFPPSTTSPSSSLPYSLRPTPDPGSASPSPMPSDQMDGAPSHPTLPAITLIDSLTAVSSVAQEPHGSYQPPTESPSLATYRPPDEPEAGPSNYHEREQTLDHTADEELTPDEMREELDHYFEEVTDADEDISEDMAPPESLTSPDDEREPAVEQAPGKVEETDEDGDEEEEEEEDANPVAINPDAQWDDALELDEDEDEGEGAPPVEVVVRVRVGVNRPIPDPPQPPPVQGPQEAAPADANEEIDGNVEDDMEGAMEAIGMRGPIYGVIQNAALMIFVLDTAIGLGVWIPFTIGKSAALLSLDPRRFVQLLHLPIRAIRVLTDPIVDSVVFIISRFLLPPVLHLLGKALTFLGHSGLFVVKSIFGQSHADHLSEVANMAYSYIPKVSELVGRPFTRVATNAANIQNTTTDFSEYLPPAVANALMDAVKRAEPHFAAIGSKVRLSATHLGLIWKECALGQDPFDRVFAVALGYYIVGLLLLTYLAVGNVKTAGKAVRNAIRQQLLVVKVAAFIFIELVTFPLGCGIVLDLCTVWLFPEASLFSRAIYFFQAPLTAMFYHWVAGTMFMYSFAILLSGCRSIMRPGAMWFIKDPQDQNSHPIRDILDRPTLTQLRKICASGVMYSIVVVCVVGSVAGLLLLGSKSIMPFRWKNREPLSNIPVDLLFLHLVLPYTMRYFRPRRLLRRMATSAWKFFARRLRLTSYFFGGRHRFEELKPKSWLTNLLWPNDSLEDLTTVWEGSLRRVPATDHIALPRDMRATAAVNEMGEPFDDTAKQLITQQNAEALKAKRDPKLDYTVVYLPPNFRARVLVLITLLWITGAIFLGVVVALPIQLGRSFFRLILPYDVHDGYSLLVGFYLLWGCYLVGKAIDRLDKRRQRRGTEGPRADLRFLVIKRGLLWFTKMTYMVFFLGIVIPTLIAIAMELYVVLPIRLGINHEMTLRIRVVDAWTLGLLYTRIVLFTQHFQPPSKITRGVQHILNNGWTHPEPVTATKEVIGPVVAGLVGMIVLPAVAWLGIQHFLPVLRQDDKLLFTLVYPGIFALVGLSRSSLVLLDWLSAWSQSIRDKEFLVEMRLRNHEPEQEKCEESKTALVKTEVG